jgi:hypothetical protein
LSSPHKDECGGQDNAEHMNRFHRCDSAKGFVCWFY